MTKYIVDGCDWQELCNGITCQKCSMLDGDACRIDEYLQKQPIYEEKPKEGEAVSRKNENDTMVENLSTSFKGTSEEGKLFLLGNISAILIDISKSLAVIADKLEKGGEAK